MTPSLRKPRFLPVDLNTVPSAMEQLADSWRRKPDPGSDASRAHGRRR